MRTERRQPENQRSGTGNALSQSEVQDNDTTLWLAKDDSWQPSVGHLLQAQFQEWRNEADQLRTPRV